MLFVVSVSQFQVEYTRSTVSIFRRKGTHEEVGVSKYFIVDDGKHASITGIPLLSGAPVEATDIRAGAGLVLAALVSEGETTVDGAFHIDRGYPNFAEDLRALGANVTRE